MAELNPPSWEQEACHTAQGDRLVTSSLVCEEGVSLSYADSLKVTPAVAALTSSVEIGSAFIDGTSVANQGMYHVFNDASKTLTHNPGHISFSRYDLIIARVRDSQYSGLDDDWILEVVEGTAAAVPAVPSVADPSWIPLSRVLITSGMAGTIPSGNYLDLRTPFISCNGGTPDTVIYTADDTFTKADYPNAVAVKARVVGGGGGGGGAETTGVGEASAGGGGGGGGYSEAIISISSLADTEVVTVGAGGSGGVGVGAASSGGSSDFYSLTAGGGQAGTSMSATTGSDIVSNGGLGGTSSGGSINLTGKRGGYGQVSNGVRIFTGVGGDSTLGNGGYPLEGTAGAGNIYGGGGGGGINNPSSANSTGGAGASGVVIIEVLY